MELLRAYLTALLDAVAPPLCVLCRGPPGALPWLCDPCGRRLTLWRAARCLHCGAPRPLPAPLCEDCPSGWPARLVAARAAGPHLGAGRDLVHALKYRGELAAARPLAALVEAATRELGVPGDAVVVPVPLHPRRRRKRGFNQALEIARPAARALGLECAPRLLRRIRDGPASWSRTARGRERTVRGAFRAPEAARGRRVVLVDDVWTTGATLASCARALGRRGAREIYAVTATRALGRPPA